GEIRGVEVGRVCPPPGRAGTKWREAYGVRGACSRFRTALNIRQREQAPRTPYASRDTTAPLAPPVQFVPCCPENLRKKTTSSDILFSGPTQSDLCARRAADPARRHAPPEV